MITMDELAALTKSKITLKEKKQVTLNTTVSQTLGPSGGAVAVSGHGTQSARSPGAAVP